MVITNKDWTDFVAEVRSRLDVIDANIANARTINDAQHNQLREDFNELKEQLIGDSDRSLANRVRSLEDSRTKMNGVQVGLSFAFSALSGLMAWVFGGHPTHVGLLSDKVSGIVATVFAFFKRG